jgi:hypothetical protein
MPAFETMDRPQTVTYWAKTGNSDLGLPVVGSPIELLVQFDDAASEALDPKGNVVTVNATVFSNRPLIIGSLVRYGTLSDWQGTGSSEQPTNLLQIISEDITDDLKGRNKVYFYKLMRFNDSLPTS